MKYVYPAILEPEDGLFNVSFPDLPDCYTCGDDLTDAMFMAEDALAGYLSRMEEKGQSVAAASDAASVSAPAGAYVTLIAADTQAYRRRISTRSVKKTLTIPEWLNAAAEEKNVNFSRTLQEALKRELQLI